MPGFLLEIIMSQVGFVGLLMALTSPGPAWVNIQGVRGILQSIQREDGSGRCHNVTLLVGNELKTLFVRIQS